MFLTVSIAYFVCCFVQRVDSLQSCQHLTCHDCIRDPIQCVWCSDDNLQPDKRCQPAALPTNWCPGGVENPTSAVNATDDRDFSSAIDQMVQLKPQRIHIKLRVGVPTPFEFSFKAAENYPVDLYFLIDASNSMVSVRDAIIQKSKEIYDTMKRLTENVYLGLGAFIEKKRVPYAQKIVNATCYSFKHVSSLGSKLSKFNDELRKLEFGGNYDIPESGLDGLAQAMTCGEKIGWRPTSRKIIIYLTDANLHVAGDGKMSGLVNPFDSKCYLNEDGFYAKENEMDYPSVSVISKLAAAEQFTTIFFNECRNEKRCKAPVIYDALVKKLSRAVSVRFTSVTISEKLQDLYKKVTTNLLLYTKVPPEYRKYFDIKFNPDCTGGTDCKVHIGEEIHVKGTIELNNYYGKDHAEITIEQQALKECLILDVDIVSSCGCEDGSRAVINSFECNRAGSKQCGICVCNKGRSGPFCACSDTGTGTKTTLGNETCIQDGVECNNNGRCVCGLCKCTNTGFGGYYCQYRIDNCKIDPFTKILCSGHGQCEDGQCHCDDDWKGEMCDCPLSASFCTDEDGIECNGRGHCECGRCKCNKLPEWDVRKYGENCEWEPCEDCHRKQCQKLIPCVSCAGTTCPEECLDKITLFNNTEELNSSRWSVCENFRVAIGCYNNFSYAYDNENHAILLLVTSKPICVEFFYIYGTISLLALLGIGVATLLAWKVMAEARDRAEFSQFLARAKGEDEEILNQCYTPPTTTYQNPMFRELSFRNNSFR